MDTVENRANQGIALPYRNAKISSDQDQIKSSTLKKRKKRKKKALNFAKIKQH